MTSLDPPIFMRDVLQRRHDDQDRENPEDLDDGGVDDGVEGKDETRGERVEREE